MDTISSLILDALVRLRKVVLPGLGTLYVSAEGSDVELNVDEEDEPHIIRLIAEAEHTDQDEAREMYNQWLVGACTDEGVVIAGVGQIHEGVFTPQPSLKTHILTSLNKTVAEPSPTTVATVAATADVAATAAPDPTPAPLTPEKQNQPETVAKEEPATPAVTTHPMERGHNAEEAQQAADILEESQRVGLRQIIWWVIGAVILGAAIAVAAILWIESQNGLLKSQPLIEPVTRVMPDSARATDSVLTTPAATLDSTQKPVSKPAGAPLKPSNPQPARPTTPQSVPSTATRPTTAVPTAATRPAATTAVAASQQIPLFRLIVGTYSSQSNADKFIASAKKQNSTLHYEKLLQPSGRVMVTVFGSDSEQQTLQMQRKLADQFPDSWIAKNRR